MFTAPPRRSRPSRTIHGRPVVEVLEDRLLLTHEVLPGFDLWETRPAGIEPPTFFNLQIPPDYLGMGSLPFDGRVDFVGDRTGTLGCPVSDLFLRFDTPLVGQFGQQSVVDARAGDGLAATDTIVQRLGTAELPNVGDSQNVPIQIVSLSLVSVRPIVVNYRDGSTAQWVVDVGLAPLPQPTGGMTMTKTHADGGTWSSTLPVHPRFTFRNLDPTGPPAQGPIDLFDMLQSNGTFELLGPRHVPSRENFFAASSVLPEHGQYFSPEGSSSSFSPTLTEDELYMVFSVAPLPPGLVTEVQSSNGTVEFDLSNDGGQSFLHVAAPVEVLVEVTPTQTIGNTQFYETEMLQLDVSGGTLPPGTMFRESPTRASTGGTSIRELPDGGFMIGSFFDVFTELSTDGGQTWSPAIAPMHLELAPLPGSIHGFKFEDTDGDGVRDEGEPGIGGVPIQAIGTNGEANIVFNTRTMADGEYWFDGLPQDFTYIVTETAPAGSVQTTLNPPPITIRAGQEYVATVEQRDALVATGLDPSRIFIEPKLQFGNTFLGSIHGFKFEDTNGNGRFDPWQGCLAPDNERETVELPSGGCAYRAVDAFIWFRNANGSLVGDVTLGNFARVATGDVNGDKTELTADVTLDLTGTGDFEGFHRAVSMPIQFEVHTAPRMPGDLVQSFDTDMFRFQGQITGDPDFDLLRIIAGTGFGLPSPGHTTLRKLGTEQQEYYVDSFFDITYRIDFVGAPGGAVAGRSGSTIGTIRMQTQASGTPGGGDHGLGGVQVTVSGTDAGGSAVRRCSAKTIRAARSCSARDSCSATRSSARSTVTSLRI
jgi:hypothetical protein